MISKRTFAPTALLLASTALATLSTPAFTAQCVDADGDGYGWDGAKTCVTNVTNNSCLDPDGDGYGWDGTKTCSVNTPPVTNSGTCSDPDGDGFGWDGVKTCTVNVTNAGACVDPDGDGFGWDGVKTCTVTGSPMTSGACVDPDGDGFGWDGVKTCSVPALPVTASACTDIDGDGYGWDGTKTCNVTPVVTANACIDIDGDGYGWDGSKTCNVTPVVPPTIPSNDITDIILMMGQSNALGENTAVDLGQDAVEPRVIVWTQFEDWQIGNLCTQKWQKAWFPWRGGTCSNHPAFQIAKHIVELDGSRRVAVIPTGSAGMPIRWWDANGIADQQVNAIVQSALASLGETEVDLIAWSQGESDHGNEQAWKLKLDDLIVRLRQRPWFDASTGQFIAQETKWSSVNSKVRELGNDGDPLTDWIQAADQPTKDGVHWSAQAIRVIGERFANKYIY